MCVYIYIEIETCYEQAAHKYVYREFFEQLELEVYMMSISFKVIIKGDYV